MLFWEQARFNVTYMLWQVAIKGAISAPCWILGWMWVDGASDEIMTLADLAYAVPLAAVISVIAATFGLVIGGIIGGILGGIYTFSNLLQEWLRIPMTAYRPMLMLGATAVSILIFCTPAMLSNDLETPVLVGGLMAGIGAAVSTYTYFDRYERHFYEPPYDYYT